MNETKLAAAPPGLDAPPSSVGPAAAKANPPRCEYAHFDRKTLAPLNEATRRRAIEVAFKRAEFEGRAVLDIGCHTGFLSFLAATKGAKKVTSYDVARPHIDELIAAQEINHLPVAGAVKQFNALDPVDDAADIVLFFEVIHWLIAQGGDIPSVIAKVAALTREQLFIEFPWDITEPSIEAQTKLTRQQYDSSIILKELGRHFENVTFRQFMTYFGTSGRSNRALVICSKKKVGGVLAAHLPGLTGLEFDLEWSRGNCRWLEGRPRSFVVKRSAPESNLQQLDEALLTRLFDVLSERQGSSLVLPMKLDGGYLLEAKPGSRSFIYEWIGEPPFGVQPVPLLSIAEMSEIAVKVTAELAQLPADLLDDLARTHLRMRVSRARLQVLLERMAPVLGMKSEQFAPWLSLADTGDSGMKTQLCHGDMNTSNVLRTNDGFRIVDLDNLFVGSPYADLLVVLANGATVEETAREIAKASAALALPPPTRQDILQGMVLALGWLGAVLPKLDSGSAHLKSVVERRINGLKSLMAFGAGLA